MFEWYAAALWQARGIRVLHRRLVAAIREHNPPLASASPVVWQRLVRHCIEADVRLPSLRMLLTTAAPIPVDLHRRLRRVVSPTTELFTPYGATEAMPVAFIGTRTILDETAENHDLKQCGAARPHPRGDRRRDAEHDYNMSSF